MYGIYIKGERGRGFAKKVHIYIAKVALIFYRITLLYYFFTGRVNNMHFAFWHMSCYSSKSPNSTFLTFSSQCLSQPSTDTVELRGRVGRGAGRRAFSPPRLFQLYSTLSTARGPQPVWIISFTWKVKCYDLRRQFHGPSVLVTRLAVTAVTVHLFWSRG